MAPIGNQLMSSSTLTATLALPAAAAIAFGASFLLVSRLERLAPRVGLSEAALGLVVALAADAPEITSAISASAHGQTSIGAGVVLGSNVFNLAALLGLSAIVAHASDGQSPQHSPDDKEAGEVDPEGRQQTYQNTPTHSTMLSPRDPLDGPTWDERAYILLGSQHGHVLGRTAWAMSS